MRAHVGEVLGAHVGVGPQRMNFGVGPLRMKLRRGPLLRRGPPEFGARPRAQYNKNLFMNILIIV